MHPRGPVGASSSAPHREMTCYPISQGTGPRGRKGTKSPTGRPSLADTGTGSSVREQSQGVPSTMPVPGSIAAGDRPRSPAPFGDVRIAHGLAPGLAPGLALAHAIATFVWIVAGTPLMIIATAQQ
jgi:hypothetical protein